MSTTRHFISCFKTLRVYGYTGDIFVKITEYMLSPPGCTSLEGGSGDSHRQYPFTLPKQTSMAILSGILIEKPCSQTMSRPSFSRRPKHVQLLRKTIAANTSSSVIHWPVRGIRESLICFYFAILRPSSRYTVPKFMISHHNPVQLF